MKKNLYIATILLNLILVFTFFVVNINLFAASVELVSPVDFDRCVDGGDIEFQWKYNNLAGAKIDSAKIVIVYNIGGQRYEVPVDNATLTSFIINSEELGLETSFEHTWTVVAYIGLDSITVRANYFVIKATPLFGLNSIEDDAICVKTSNPIIFDWTLEGNYYTDYVVQISEHETFEDSIIAQAVNSTSASATLATNTTYYWRLQDANCEDNVSATRKFTTELATATNLLPKDFGTCEGLFVENNINQIELQWQEPNTGSNYNYHIKLWNLTNDSSLIVDFTVLDTSFVLDITELYNQKLQWEVTTIDEESGCQSQPTKKLTFFTPMAMPIAKYPANNETCVLLSSIFEWTDEEAEALDSLATNDIHYQFRISEDEDFPADSTQTVNVVSEEDIDDPNKTGIVKFAKPSTTYYWAMRKVEVLSLDDTEKGNTIENYSHWTNTFAIRTAIATTELVSPENNLFGIDAKLELTWKHNEIADSYRLQIASDLEFNDITVDTLVAGTVHLFEGINAEQHDYYWRVSCLKENDNCESDFTDPRLFSLRISTPNIVSPKDNETETSNAVTFVWSKVPGASVYDMEYSTNSSAFETRPDLVEKQSNIMDTARRIALVANATYYWRVRAKSSQNIYSEWSPLYSFKSGSTAPATPTLISPVHNQERVSRLSTFFWNKTNNAVNYELEIAYSSDFVADRIVLDKIVSDTNYTIKDSITANSETIKILLPNTRYYWRVRAINGDVAGSWSGIWAFTTFLDKPTTAVTLATPANNDSTVDADNATFTWSYHAQAQWYKVRIMDVTKNVVVDTNIFGTNFRYIKLAPQTSYYWQVLPCNENGDGSIWSQEFMFKTRPFFGIIDNTIISSIDIYPNPLNASSVLNINLLQPARLNIKIYDLSGNELQNIHIFTTKGTNTLDFANHLLPNGSMLANGVYNLVVFADGKWIGTVNFVYNLR